MTARPLPPLSSLGMQRHKSRLLHRKTPQSLCRLLHSFVPSLSLICHGIDRIGRGVGRPAVAKVATPSSGKRGRIQGALPFGDVTRGRRVITIAACRHLSATFWSLQQELGHHSKRRC
jgi:hypothetical protein